MKDRRSVRRIREDARPSDLNDLVKRYKLPYTEGSMGIPAAAVDVKPAGSPHGPAKVKGAARRAQAQVIAAARELSFTELNRTRAANAEGFFPDKFDKDGDLLAAPDPKDLAKRFKIDPPSTTPVEGI